MTDETFARASWQGQDRDPQLPTLEELRASSSKFYRRVRRRNAIEYAACVFVVVCFGIYTLTLEHMLQRAGSAMVVVATLYVAWQLNRRASAVRPEASGVLSIYAAIRVQLVRQRDALASVFWWYLLPFVPGLATMSVGSALLNRQTGAHGPLFGVMAAVVMIAVFAGILLLNRRAARYLQHKIDEIDALTGESE